MGDIRVICSIATKLLLWKSGTRTFVIMMQTEQCAMSHLFFQNKISLLENPLTFTNKLTCVISFGQDRRDRWSPTLKTAEIKGHHVFVLRDVSVRQTCGGLLRYFLVCKPRTGIGLFILSLRARTFRIACRISSEHLPILALHTAKKSKSSAKQALAIHFHLSYAHAVHQQH